MSSQLPDDWIERLRAREHEAFNELVRLHHGAVYRLALRMLRHRDDAQEVAQESFLAAYEGIGGFAGRASLKTWLLSIAYRKTVDRLKRRGDEGAIISGVLDDSELWRIAQSVQNLTDWGVNPEQHYSRTQLSEHLGTSLGRLPADSRAVFELRDLQGLTSQEAADILGISEGAVRVRLHRVRQYLMRELQSLFGGSGVHR